MHKQWGLSLYNTSVTCDQLNDSKIILQKKSNKNAADKIHLSHVNALLVKKETPNP